MSDLIARLIRIVTYAIAVLTFILNFLNQFPVQQFRLAPASSQYPYIPDGIAVLVSMVVLYLVVQGLKTLSNILGRDFTYLDTMAAAWLTGVVLFSGNSIIAILPGDWQARIAVFFQLVLLFVGSAGVWRTLKGLSGAQFIPAKRFGGAITK